MPIHNLLQKRKNNNKKEKRRKTIKKKKINIIILTFPHLISVALDRLLKDPHSLIIKILVSHY